MTSEAEFVISHFSGLYQQQGFQPSRLGVTIPIPRFEPSIYYSICDQAIQILRLVPTVPHITSPVQVVGDLHGALGDLMRILIKCGNPDNNKYIFLGDYVDRGEFSLEVITFLLALHIKYPCQITMLRGNHEFPDICSSYGFKDELNSTFGKESESAFEKFNMVFAYLPLAAVLDESVLCVHGGIAPNLQSIDDIAQIKKPVFDSKDPLIENILWSDPCHTVNGFIESPRGRGYLFGASSIHQFLTQNKLLCIIRGHQCEKEGVKLRENGEIVTVFSSSSYHCLASNNAGVLSVLKIGLSKVVTLEPYARLSRDEAIFRIVRKDPQSDTTPPQLPNLAAKPRRQSEAITIPKLNTIQTKTPRAKPIRPPAISSPTPPPCNNPKSFYLDSTSASVLTPHYLHLINRRHSISLAKPEPL